VTSPPTDVRALLARHDLRPSRALGQNFVTDANTVRRIARLAGVGPGDRVVEIGAGLGALTVALADAGAKVTAVELDRRLLPVLRDVVDGRGVHVVEGDALTLDWRALLGASSAPPASVDPPGPMPTGTWTVVGNLPYNVAVPVVLRVLDEAADVQTIFVMVQREVGERLAAAPGSKAYGAVSVHVAYHATARIMGHVPASVFVPRPRVESSLVRIDRRAEPAVEPDVVPPDQLFALVRAGFAQRRKMLRRALAGIVPASAFDAAGVDSARRAESLTVEEWGRLTACARGGDR
jgi:16S rRNA (adenine1518-N6/adenine1519-N6)-dimethyltransferase